MRSSRPCVGCSQKPDAAEPDLGLKPLLARLRKSSQSPDLDAGSRHLKGGPRGADGGAGGERGCHGCSTLSRRAPASLSEYRTDR